MVTNFSPNLLLQEMTPGDPAVTNAWGANLNTGVIALLDTAVAGLLVITTTGGTTVLTSVAGAADQSRNSRIQVNGTLTSGATILWPQGLGRKFTVFNNTTGSFTLTLGANNGSGSPAGTTQTVSQNSTGAFYSDGTNVLPDGASGGGGGGAVSSVGLADTSGTPIYIITNSPVTSSGTIDITLNNQNPMLVFAGPASGGAAQPSFRALQTSDLPTAPQNTVLAGPASGGSGPPTYRALVAADGVMLLTTRAQSFSGGVRVTSFSGGTQSSGTYTPDPGNGPLQFITNGGAFTFAAPSFDGAFDTLITNGSGAGSITFSGFTVSSNTGDALTATVGNQFILSIRRINGTSSYIVKALQ